MYRSHRDFVCIGHIGTSCFFIFGGGAPCIRIGVMKDNFVFDHFLHFYDYKNVQLG